MIKEEGPSVSSEPNLRYSLLNKSNADGRRNFKQRRKIGINECWGPRCIPLELKNSRRQHRNKRKRNKSVTKWECSSWCVHTIAPRSPKSRPSRARQRQKNKTFPSEYSFAICLISLAFLTELCTEGDEKKILSFLLPTTAYILPNFRIFMQSDTANNSNHLSVPFYFLLANITTLSYSFCGF